VRGLEAKLDEHRKIVNMFPQTTKYNTQMTNILLRFFNLEIKNKQIIEEKDKYVQNLQGVLEKELQMKQDENNEVLVEL
jgi:hypothetical protein